MLTDLKEGLPDPDELVWISVNDRKTNGGYILEARDGEEGEEVMIKWVTTGAQEWFFKDELKYEKKRGRAKKASAQRTNEHESDSGDSDEFNPSDLDYLSSDDDDLLPTKKKPAKKKPARKKPARKKKPTKKDSDELDSEEDNLPIKQLKKNPKKKPARKVTKGIPVKKMAKRAKRKDAAWNRRFQELKDYVDKYGNARVPSMYVDNPSLGNWVQHMRREWGEIGDEKKRKLKEVGLDVGDCRKKRRPASDTHPDPDVTTIERNAAAARQAIVDQHHAFQAYLRDGYTVPPPDQVMHCFYCEKPTKIFCSRCGQPWHHSKEKHPKCYKMHKRYHTLKQKDREILLGIQFEGAEAI